MHTLSRPARPRRRTVVVAVLVTLGVLVPMGVGHAAPSAAGSPSAAAAAEDPEKGKVCADGKRDDNPADGLCSRDKKDGDKKEGDKKDGDKKESDGKKKDGDKKDGDKKDAPPPPPPDPNIVAGTPCTKAAEACADLDGKKGWLIKDGNIVFGPVPIAGGGPKYPTPRGDHKVLWKNKDHRSMEFNNTPMPFSVFFTEGGVAFHQGALDNTSHGCIRLKRADAEMFFNTLAVGADVQVR